MLKIYSGLIAARTEKQTDRQIDRQTETETETQRSVDLEILIDSLLLIHSTSVSSHRPAVEDLTDANQRLTTEAFGSFESTSKKKWTSFSTCKAIDCVGFCRRWTW